MILTMLIISMKKTEASHNSKFFQYEFNNNFHNSKYVLNKTKSQFMLRSINCISLKKETFQAEDINCYMGLIL